MKKAIKMIFMTSLVAIAGMAKAELSETFESYQDWSYVGSTNFMNRSPYSWVGMAHVEDLTNEVVSVAGYPITEGVNPHMKAVCALGAVYTENPQNGNSSKYSQVEYLQQVTITTDHLVTDEIQDVQIALATGMPLADDPNMVEVNLYCLPKNATQTAWVVVGKARLGTYMRVNLAFDYENQSCRVSVDGIPCMSEHGFLLPDCEETDGIGAWYQLGTKAYNEKRENVSTIQFVGLNTKWDEVKISEEKFSDHAPFPKNQEVRVNLVASGISAEETPHWMNVSLDDLNRWAIDDEIDTTTIRLDKSGHTVKEKLELGYDPMDGKKFAPTNMTMQLTQSGAERVTLMIPKAKADGDLVYRIIATGTEETGAAFRQELKTERNTLEDATMATGELPANAPRVLFFRLEAERSE